LRNLTWLVVPFGLAVYLATMAPAVGLIDSGELAAGCHLLNILHPTGYPLYTVLGRLVSLIPVGSVVNRVAGMSAVLAAAGVGLLLLLFRRMKLDPVASAAVALGTGLSLPVWSVAVDVEVYALSLALGVLVWLSVEAARDRRFLLLAAFLAGLALTNHMSATSIVAGAGLAFVVERWQVLKRRWFVLLLFFLLGLSPYLFLVLRARAGPLLAWGNPVDLERFWWHVTGKQYRVWMFSLPFSEVLANAGRGLVLLGRSLLVVLVPVAGYGLVKLYRARRGLAMGLAVSVLLCFLYAVNYSIPDIEAYFIPCVVGLGILAAVGSDALCRRLGRFRHAFWLVPVAALALNFTSASRRGHHVALDGARNTLASAADSAVVLTEWWDFYSPSLYLEHVEGARPDLCVIDKELVRRSWYFDYLENAYPWLVENSSAEIDRYRVYLDRFEHGTLRDPAGIQGAFTALLESFVRNNPGRPGYVTFDPYTDRDAREMFRDRRWTPVGLLFELREDTLMPPFDYDRFRVRLPARADPRTQANLSRYSRFARARFELLSRAGREDEAAALREWHEAAFGRGW